MEQSFLFYTVYHFDAATDLEKRVRVIPHLASSIKWKNQEGKESFVMTEYTDIQQKGSHVN